MDQERDGVRLTLDVVRRLEHVAEDRLVVPPGKAELLVLAIPVSHVIVVEQVRLVQLHLSDIEQVCDHAVVTQ